MEPKVLNRYHQKVVEEASRHLPVVNIMRPGKWGNPFSIGGHGDRQEVIAKFDEYIRSRPDLLRDAKKELKGKHLLCCCKPRACHGDILLEIANSE